MEDNERHQTKTDAPFVEEQRSDLEENVKMGHQDQVGNLEASVGTQEKWQYSSKKLQQGVTDKCIGTYESSDIATQTTYALDNDIDGLAITRLNLPDMEFLDEFCKLYLNENEFDGESVASSSTYNDNDTANELLRMIEEENKDESSNIQIYPIGQYQIMVCLVCFDHKPLWLRLCCNEAICTDCMKQYCEMQIMTGNVKMPCPAHKCSHFVNRLEILSIITPESKNKFDYFLANANAEANIKTCPQCNSIKEVDCSLLSVKTGLNVTCDECCLVWCFTCQAPWHEGLSCSDYCRGDKLLKGWSKEFNMGQKNAQKCPRCKIYIQRASGCDYMTCSKCGMPFCYQCGGKFYGMSFIGDHFSAYSIFGCKYRYHPDKPVFRRLIRGAIFGGKVAALPVVAGLAVGAVGVGLGLGVIALPFWGGYRIHKSRKKKSQRKRAHALQKRLMDAQRPSMVNGQLRVQHRKSSGNDFLNMQPRSAQIERFRFMEVRDTLIRAEVALPEFKVPKAVDSRHRDSWTSSIDSSAPASASFIPGLFDDYLDDDDSDSTSEYECSKMADSCSKRSQTPVCWLWLGKTQSCNASTQTDIRFTNTTV